MYFDIALHYHASALALHLRDMGENTHIWELQCTLAEYTTFKAGSNAIEFAKGELDRMDAGLQALRSLSGQLGRC